MAFDYDELAATATELLAEFGAAGTLTRKGQSGALGADGRAVLVGAGGATPVIGLEMVAGTQAGMPNAGKQTDDGGVKRFRASHMLAPLEQAPESGDVLTLNGVVATIKDVRTVSPAGRAICHFVEVGRP